MRLLSLPDPLRRAALPAQPDADEGISFAVAGLGHFSGLCESRVQQTG